MNDPIGLRGSFSPARERRTASEIAAMACSCPTTRLCSSLLHVEQLLALRGEHPRHGNARPARYDLGHVLRVDLLFDEGVVAGSRLKLGLQGLDLFLRLDDLAVAQLRPRGRSRLGVRPAAPRPCSVRYRPSGAGSWSASRAVPATWRASRRRANAALQSHLVRRCDAFLVVFAADRFTFDLQLSDTAVEVVDLFGYGVHLQP